MSISERISPFFGRLLLAWFFFSQVWLRLADWDGTTALMEMKDIAQPAPILALILLLMALGGFAVLFGYQTRVGALVLFAFTMTEAILFHNYWTIHNKLERSAEFATFVQDMAVAGGLLLLVGMGPGPFALDNAPKKRK